MWLSNALFWAALPFLVPQALYVRRTAPRFADAGGAREGTAGSGPERRLAAFGDSIIAGVGASDLERALVGRTSSALADRLQCRVRWTAQGHTGANSTRLIRKHLPRLSITDADVVLLSVGVNDVTSLTPMDRWRDNLNELFDHLTTRNGELLVAFTGLPPLGGFPLLPQPLRAVLGLRARLLDQAARETIDSWPQVVHIPVDFDTSPERFAPDGYHPSEESYVTFGEVVADAIATRLQVQ